MLIGGDFRQIPPVIRRIDSSAIRQYSLHAARFFKNASTEKYTLRRNMRAAGDNDFADFVLNVGDGTHRDIPDGMSAHPDIPYPWALALLIIESIFSDE